MPHDARKVRFGCIVNGFFECRYAVVEHRGSREQAVARIVSHRLELVHRFARADIGFFQEIRIAGKQIVIIGSLHPNDLIPILMSDGSSPVGYMPQGAFHHLGDEQIRPVPCIDGHIAGPLSAIVGTCRQNAVANIVTDRLHGQFPRFVYFWTICFEHHPRAGTMRPARNQHEECQKSCNGIFHIFMISLKVHRGLSIGTSAVNFSWEPDVSYGIVRYTLTG